MSRAVAAVSALTLAATLAGSTAGTAIGSTAGTAVGSTAGTAVTGARVAGATYQRGVSEPVEDSYYPGKGDPGIDVLHYDLDLTWVKRKRLLKGVATLRLRATRDAPGFQLDLGDPLRVRRVRVDGATAAHRHPGKTLHVRRAMTEDRRYTVRIRYQGRPKPVRAPSTRYDMRRLGWHTTPSGQVWAMQQPFGAFTWFPANDQPSDKALYDIEITAPGRWVGISNGRLRSRRHHHGRTTTRWRSADPMSTYLVTIAIGPYRRVRQRGPHDLPMSYWVPRGRPGLVQPLLRTPGAVRWLERRLGRYPFDRVGVVVVPADSAMETQTMITLGVRGYRDGRRLVRQTMVHELAHAWYGDSVTPRDWRDVWMSEGMATYLETRWAVEQGWTRWRAWQREWRADDQLWRTLFGPPGAYDRKNFAALNVYYSAALMLDELRREIGTARFDALARAWPQEHRHTNQSRESYLAWLESRTGRELSGFLTRWLTSPLSPAR